MAWEIVPVTYKQYYAFRQRFMRGMHPHERLGQAFYNEFLGGERWPELFYETNVEKAQKMIVTGIENYDKKDD